MMIIWLYAHHHHNIIGCSSNTVLLSSGQLMARCIKYTHLFIALCISIQHISMILNAFVHLMCICRYCKQSRWLFPMRKKSALGSSAVRQAYFRVGKQKKSYNPSFPIGNITMDIFSSQYNHSAISTPKCISYPNLPAQYLTLCVRYSEVIEKPSAVVPNLTNRVPTLSSSKMSFPTYVRACVCMCMFVKLRLFIVSTYWILFICSLSISSLVLSLLVIPMPLMGELARSWFVHIFWLNRIQTSKRFSYRASILFESVLKAQSDNWNTARAVRFDIKEDQREKEQNNISNQTNEEFPYESWCVVIHR